MAGRDVYVVVEGRPERLAEVTFELLGDARALADKSQGQVVAILPLGGSPPADDRFAEALAAQGADRVVVLQHDGDETTPEADLAALLAYLGERTRGLVLLADTAARRAQAAALAVRWHGAVASACQGFRFLDDGSVEATRRAFGGRVHEVLRVQADVPLALTLIPGVAGVGRAQTGRRAEVERVDLTLGEAIRRVEVSEFLPPDLDTLDITEADRLVAGGRGVGGPEGFAKLRELGQLLGAAVAASRVAVDLGWVDYARQVGQSGKKVAPELYMAFGISGASQHVSGIEGAGTVVAVNLDRNAPILKLAQLGVVGDVNEIVPLLIERLRARSAERTTVS